jgi:hypothetical protein
MSRRSFLVLIAIHIRTKISAPLRFINILAQTWDCTIFFTRILKIPRIGIGVTNYHISLLSQYVSIGHDNIVKS